MAARPHPLDPRYFTAKTSPPEFDIDTRRDEWRTWRRIWLAWLGTSGINRLIKTDPEGDAQVTADMVSAAQAITKDSLLTALQGSGI